VVASAKGQNRKKQEEYSADGRKADWASLDNNEED
jgi:hypothetical protein